nr:hypothetical protein 1 [bacterium]
MNFRHLVWMLTPGRLTDMDYEYALWEGTAFPFVGVKTVTRQLIELGRETEIHQANLREQHGR